jgi:hypothetical protein
MNIEDIKSELNKVRDKIEPPLVIYGHAITLPAFVINLDGRDVLSPAVTVVLNDGGATIRVMKPNRTTRIFTSAIKAAIYATEI